MRPFLEKSQAQGVWFMLHLQSYLANTEHKQKEFIKLLYNTAKYFPCTDCSNHARAYLDRYPVEYGFDISHSTPAVFIYMFEFHNFVNQRLNKPLADFNDVYEFYSTLVSSRDNGVRVSRKKPCKDCQTR